MSHLLFENTNCKIDILFKKGLSLKAINKPMKIIYLPFKTKLKTSCITINKRLKGKHLTHSFYTLDIYLHILHNYYYDF